MHTADSSVTRLCCCLSFPSPRPLLLCACSISEAVREKRPEMWSPHPDGESGWGQQQVNTGRVVFFFFPTKEMFLGVTHLRLCVGYVKDWKLVLTYMLGKRFVVSRHKVAFKIWEQAPRTQEAENFKSSELYSLHSFSLVYKTRNNFKLVFSMLC